MERRVIVLGRPRAVRGVTAAVRPSAPVDPIDPFHALMDAWFDASLPRARWAVVAGDEMDARIALDTATTAKVLLVVRTGHPGADALLADLSPALGRLLDDMTAGQRRLARILLVDGRRQTDAAGILGISRASVSVAHGRARIHEIGSLLHAVRASWGTGWRAVAGDVRRGPLTDGATVPR